jgi:hypothetical protein
MRAPRATRRRPRRTPCSARSTSTPCGTVPSGGKRRSASRPPAPGRPSRRASGSRASRAELHDAIRAADGLALGSIRQTHARLGELDLYQWILFVGEHEARHVQQAAEIAEQLGVAR